MRKKLTQLYYHWYIRCYIFPNPENDGFTKYEVIKGKFVSGELPTDPNSSKWKDAPEQTVYLYPQISVRLNDKKQMKLYQRRKELKQK